MRQMPFMFYVPKSDSIQKDYWIVTGKPQVPSIRTNPNNIKKGLYPMPTEYDVDQIRNMAELALLVEKLGYRNPTGVQYNNGAYVASIEYFFDDNSDAMEAVKEFIVTNMELSDTEDDGDLDLGDSEDESDDEDSFDDDLSADEA